MLFLCQQSLRERKLRKLFFFLNQINNNLIKGIEKPDSNDDSSKQAASSSHKQINANKKDLLLRDQTRTFIQTISIFIRLLSNENQKLDTELKEIMLSLNHLIETIETLEVSNHSKIINNKIHDLETLLAVMIDELKKNHFDNVVNTALELASNANELFLAITTKTANKTSNV